MTTDDQGCPPRYRSEGPRRGDAETKGHGDSATRPPSALSSEYLNAFMTRCSFCAHEFTEEEGEKACSKCAAFGGCKMVMCPRCGYEMPQTPKLVRMIQQWRRRRVGAR